MSKGTKFVANLLFINFSTFKFRREYDLEINELNAVTKKSRQIFREKLEPSILRKPIRLEFQAETHVDEPNEITFEFLLIYQKEVDTLFKKKLVDNIVTRASFVANEKGQLVLNFQGIVKKKKVTLLSGDLFYSWRKKDLDDIMKLKAGEVSSKYFVAFSPGGITRSMRMGVSFVLSDTSQRATTWVNNYAQLLEVINISHNNHFDNQGAACIGSTIVFYRKKQVDDQDLLVKLNAFNPPKLEKLKLPDEEEEEKVQQPVENQKGEEQPSGGDEYGEIDQGSGGPSGKVEGEGVVVGEDDKSGGENVEIVIGDGGSEE